MRMIGKNTFSLFKGFKNAGIFKLGLNPGITRSINFFSKVSPKKINIYLSTINDIHFNLATEEYLFEHKKLKHPTLFL